MKRIFKSGLMVALLVSALTAFGQDNGVRITSASSSKDGRGPYLTNGFFDNLFVGVAGGVNVYTGDDDQHGPFGRRLAPAVDVNVGKWITPAVGLRIGYSGLKAYGWSNFNSPYSIGLDADLPGFYRERFNVSYLHGDFLWNISNVIGGYRESRLWSFIPFATAGWARSFKDTALDNEIAVGLGLLNEVRITDLIYATLEARYVFTNQRFDHVERMGRGEGLISTTLGVTFKFNRRGFKRVSRRALHDASMYMERITLLEADNEDLKAENQRLIDENQALKEQQQQPVEEVLPPAPEPEPEPPVEEPAPQPAEPATPDVVVDPTMVKAVFFNRGAATLDLRELAKLNEYALAIRAESDRVFSLIGMADAGTGDPQLNLELSMKRAKYVCDLLIEDFGVNPAQLQVSAMGDQYNRYALPELNRSVIIE